MSIVVWNIAGAERKPKGRTWNWNRPSRVIDCFVAVVFINCYFPVTAMQIYGSKVSGLSDTIQGVIFSWQRINIFFSDFIYFPISRRISAKCHLQFLLIQPVKLSLDDIVFKHLLNMVMNSILLFPWHPAGMLEVGSFGGLCYNSMFRMQRLVDLAHRSKLILW